MKCMHYYEVAPNQIARAGDASFTYHSDSSLSIGSVVEIPLGKKSSIGIVIEKVDKPKYPTKPVAALLEDNPLPAPLVNLALWLSHYYTTPLATVLQTLLPAGIKKTRKIRVSTHKTNIRERTNFVFNKQQEAAVNTLDSLSEGTIILHGITGSGKTAVYIDVVKKCIANGKSAIVLVPEIALTSQIVEEFSHHFDDIILTHSRQTEAERHLAWLESLNATNPRLVIGPRSALFMPLNNIGAIIIDECHEPSYKQEQSPRYSALRAATILAREHHAKVILGSATPSIADYYLAKTTNHPIVVLSTSARTETVKPNIEIVDMTKRQQFKKHRFLSDKLLNQIEISMRSGEQCLIFHNRRGSASTTLCENCGWLAGCPRCFVPLTLHADMYHLRCHVCGYSTNVPTSCPECHAANILHKGIGTKLIESELNKLFPDKTVVRFDGDTHSMDTIEARYEDIYNGKINIIVGTQIVAKGLDLPHLRTVGVIQADAGLSLPDYSSSERTFQLLAQVIGRVGRSHHATNVIVQSYQPTHPSVIAGLNQDYDSFYRFALAERKRGNFPPFIYLLKLICTYKTEANAVKNAQKLASVLRQMYRDRIEILGPTPAFYERQRDTYRWQLIIKSSKRSMLVEVLKNVPDTHWQSELDPVSLL